jgi:glutaminyl-tRNA synthetase
LFTDETPTGHKDKDFMEFFNHNSLETVKGYAEPALVSAQPGDQFQFMRIGYFCCDLDSTATNPIFNRTVTLRDGWKKKK